MLTVYERVQRRGYRRGQCAVCGKTVERQRTFEQTINPWNQNPDGSCKSRYEIERELVAEVRAWRDSPLLHKKCEATS